METVCALGARARRAHSLHQRAQLRNIPELAHLALPGVHALAVRGGVDVPLHPHMELAAPSSAHRRSRPRPKRQEHYSRRLRLRQSAARRELQAGNRPGCRSGAHGHLHTAGPEVVQGW